MLTQTLTTEDLKNGVEVVLDGRTVVRWQNQTTPAASVSGKWIVRW